MNKKYINVFQYLHKARDIHQLTHVLKIAKKVRSGYAKVRSVSCVWAHLSIIYATFTIDKCAHMRETERISKNNGHP